MKRCLIIANGKNPSKRKIIKLVSLGYNFIICADGGAEAAKKLNIKPDVIIGDLDSVSNETLKYFNEVEVIQYRRQNDTDVEKCLKYAIRKKFTEVILVSATGDRLDHIICNLGIVIKFFQKIKIHIIHEENLLSCFNSSVKIPAAKGETISLYGFGEGCTITSTGLKYEMKNKLLVFGKNESTSNVAATNEVNLSIKKGYVFVVRNFKNVIKHGIV